MQELFHIVYASRAGEGFQAMDIDDLLEVSRSNNAALDVTGMLLYVDGSFFQILEGDQATVERLYRRISRDPRHAKVVKVIAESISKRAFANWSMGYAGVSPEELADVEGLNDFFAQQNCLTELGPGRAKKLLQAFAKGRWRLA